jgi:hypothetical protein
MAPLFAERWYTHCWYTAAPPTDIGGAILRSAREEEEV